MNSTAPIRPSILFLVLLLMSAPFARGQGGGVNPRAALDREAGLIKDIEAGTVDTRFDSKLDGYSVFKADLKESTGFEYLWYWANMYHTASRSRAVFNGQAHFINAWTPFQDSPNSGTALFYFMHLGKHTSTTVGQLSSSMGLSTGVSDTLVDLDIYRMAAWRQPLFDDKLEVVLGQFQLRDLYDVGEYADDDTLNFHSQIMSGNPSETLPFAGLGAASTFHLNDQWSFGFGFSDANARPLDLWNASTFSQGDYAYFYNVTFRPEVPGLGPAVHRLSYYHVDATAIQDSSRGFIANLQQDIGENYVATLKYNRADQRRGAIKQAVAVAGYRKGVGKWKDDLIGFGAGWGDPTNGNLRDEFVVEGFWRMQWTNRFQFTPNIQFWPNTSRQPTAASEAVFSLRGRIDF